MKKLLTTLLLATGISLAVAQDSAPYFLSYQGRVTDGAGLAIGNSTPENRLVRFQIYSSATGGTPIYGEQQTATISGGEFSVLIGNGQAISGVSGPSNNTAIATILSNMSNTSLYLGVSVAASSGNFTSEISPRQQLVAGAFSFRSKVAETVTSQGVTASMLATGAVTNDKIAANAVTSNKIAAGAVTLNSITDASITSAKIASSTITSSNIDGNSVGLWSVSGSNISRNAGNVGIGISSPSAPLTVLPGSSTTPDGNGIYVNTPTSGRNSIIGTRVVSGGGAPIYSMDISGVAGWTMGIDPNDGQALKFGATWDNPFGGNTRLTLARNGNLSLPSAAWFYLTAPTNGNAGIQLFGAGSDWAQIYFNGGEDAGELRIQTRDNGDEPINMMIGDTSRLKVTNTGIEVAAVIRSVGYRNGNTACADMYYSSDDPPGSATAGALVLRTYNTSQGGLNWRHTAWDGDGNWDFESDQRLKENINDVEPMLARLLDLKVRRYDWKNGGGSQQLGVVAQEVQPLFPDVVKTYQFDNGLDKTLTVSYDSFGLIAVKSIQELHASLTEELDEKDRKIQDLDEKLDAKDRKIQDLEKRLEKLERLIESR
jgi:hypothetical protein